MITLIIGENAYERDQAVARIIGESGCKPERRTGSEMAEQDLLQLMQGVSLFESSQLIVIRELSENKPLWSLLEQRHTIVPDDSHLVLIEPKPDKRTKTYKTLQKKCKSY